MSEYVPEPEAAPVETEPGVDPVEAVAEPVEPEAAPVFDPQAAYQTLEQQIAQQNQILAYLAQQAGQPAQAAPPAPVEEEFELDLFDPSSARQGIERILDQRLARLEERLNPIVEAQESQRAQQFVEQTMDQLKVPPDPIGETGYTTRDATLLLAQGFRAQGFDPNQAIALAHQLLGAYGDNARKAGRTSHVQELEQVRQAVAPPVGNTTGPAVQGRRPPRSLMESAERILAANGG